MKFTEEQLKKIRESMSASGIPDDVVEFTINDISADEESTQSEEESNPGDPTENPEEGNPDDRQAEGDKPEEQSAEEQPGEPAPVEEPVVEEQPEVVPEGEPAPQPEDMPPAEEPVVEEPAPSVGYDDSELRQMLQDAVSEIQEYKKAMDGMQERVNSLEEALKKGGYLDDSEAPVGDETPKAPAQIPVDDPMDDVLAQINNKNY